MSYEQFLGSLGAPQRATGAPHAAMGAPHAVDGPMNSGSLALAHLSVVPDPVEPMLTPDDPLWQENALCAQTDPEAFFPEKGGSTREAKRICLGCEVKDACLEYALANDERFGIWGGLSERERRRLKRGII